MCRRLVDVFNDIDADAVVVDWSDRCRGGSADDGGGADAGGFGVIGVIGVVIRRATGQARPCMHLPRFVLSTPVGYQTGAAGRGIAALITCLSG